MYARLVRFSLGTGKRDVAQAIADELAPKIAGQPGCGGVTVFGDDKDGEYGIFVLWQSEAHAGEAAAIIRPILDKHLSGQVQQPPEARLFEVISG
jgi:heme-degrading monooxygenase HmoA